MGGTVIFTANARRATCPDQTDEAELVILIDELISRLSEPGEPALPSCAEECDLVDRARRVARTTAREIVELNRRVIQLERLALTDELTGLLNRRGFTVEVDRAIARARRYGDEGALIYVDIDDFKGINDAWGHAVGDRVLQHVARALIDSVRCTDSVGRLGGDEFAVLLSRASATGSRKRVAEIARHLRPAIVPIDGGVLQVYASIGLQFYGSNHCLDIADLLDRADRSMYAEKRVRDRGQAVGPLALSA